MTRLLIALILSFLTTSLYSITILPPEKPSLVVSIVIDNLSTQDIERNAHLLTQDGILKIINEGTSFTNASYPYSANSRECDYASLVTGTTPRHHGIVADQWYNPKTEKYTQATASQKTVLIGEKRSKKGYDAKQLQVSTFSDELSLNTLSDAKIFSISLDKNAAILLGGHATDGAFWMSEKTGKWISSDYYMAWLPEWVESFNKQGFADFYLTQDWTLSFPPHEYKHNPKSYDESLFPISLSEYQGKDTPFDILHSTPMGAMYVIDFASQLIKKEKLGSQETPDILFLNFSDITDKRLDKGSSSIEKEDYIIKLDKEIARFLKLLKDEIGEHQCLTMLTSTQQRGNTLADLKENRIPSGAFNTERSKALLNSYLMALHGQGKWVLEINNQQIYLNKELITKSRLNFQDFQENVAQFMEEFSGIKWAIPAYQLKYADFNEKSFLSMQESYFPNRSGDVMFCYHPGWAEENTKAQTHYAQSNNNKIVPLAFYGWKIERKTIDAESPITNIAKTIAQILKTNTPNGSNKGLLINE